MHAASDRRLREHGFTLTSTLLTLTAVGVVAGATVPRLVGRERRQQEALAIAVLKKLCSAQQQFQAAAIVDADLDGRGEYATLGELVGQDRLRHDDHKLAPPLAPPELRKVDVDGIAEVGHWRICLWLPDSLGTGTTGRPGAAQVDAGLATSHWTAAAWPIDRRISGLPTFFVNQTGELRRSDDAQYSGEQAPFAGAAMLGVDANQVDGPRLARGPGADGCVWLPVW
ncbi:MAG: hypothetical protein IPK26_20195 [Planctomycetes bacterium]|nr:hypothetical protein [Planctomycetota bacterium]